MLGIVRDPRHPEAHGTVVSDFTENVDVFPTICDAIGIDVPAQCDGMPLTPFLAGRAAPVVARRGALGIRLALGVHLPGPAPLAVGPAPRVQAPDGAAFGRRPPTCSTATAQWRCFDLAADPGWGTEITDPGVVLEHAQSMLTWRSRHADRTLSDMLLYDGGIGRVPGCRADDAPRAPGRCSTLDGVGPSEETDGLSELDHGLQCAFELARARPDDGELHVAGLVHDIGHRFGPDERPRRASGGRQVRRLLGDRVAGLVEAHVPAKRYLVTTDASLPVAAVRREHPHPRRSKEGRSPRPRWPRFEASSLCR